MGLMILTEAAGGTKGELNIDLNVRDQLTVAAREGGYSTVVRLLRPGGETVLNCDDLRNLVKELTLMEKDRIGSVTNYSRFFSHLRTLATDAITSGRQIIARD